MVGKEMTEVQDHTQRCKTTPRCARPHPEVQDHTQRCKTTPRKGVAIADNKSDTAQHDQCCMKFFCKFPFARK